MESTSTSLLRRLRQPADRQAWSRFVELYTPLIYHWGRRAGLSAEDAADLTQEVLVLLVRKLPEFEYDRGKSFRGWLRTLTLNKWREQRRRRGVPAVNVSESALANIAEPDPAAAYWETEFRQHLVHSALRSLLGTDRPRRRGSFAAARRNPGIRGAAERRPRGHRQDQRHAAEEARGRSEGGPGGRRRESGAAERRTEDGHAGSARLRKLCSSREDARKSPREHRAGGQRSPAAAGRPSAGPRRQTGARCSTCPTPEVVGRAAEAGGSGDRQDQRRRQEGGPVKRLRQACA